MKSSFESFGRYFLVEFTEELINNYRKISFRKIAEREERVKEEVKKIELLKHKPTITEKLGKKEIRKIPTAKMPFFPRMKIRGMPLTLKIPEPRLPPQFSYLAPTPTGEEIDLGKLNPLIRDPLVKIIECNGADEHTIVQGTMGRKPTAIILNKEEIDDIIGKFSEAAKIPVNKGIYRVVVGRLIFSAIISDIISSKFIIKKMAYAPAT